MVIDHERSLQIRRRIEALLPVWQAARDPNLRRMQRVRTRHRLRAFRPTCPNRSRSMRRNRTSQYVLREVRSKGPRATDQGCETVTHQNPPPPSVSEKPKKITKSTFRSFIYRNRSRLEFKSLSSYHGGQDAVVENRSASFVVARETTRSFNYTLGIEGVWIVGGSRDYFSTYEDAEYIGIQCHNSCGSFVVAVRK